MRNITLVLEILYHQVYNDFMHIIEMKLKKSCNNNPMNVYRSNK